MKERAGRMKDTSTWRSLEITATQTNRPRANPPSTRVTGESCNRITNFKEISCFLIGVFRVFKLLAQKKALTFIFRVHSGYCESEEAEVAERRRRTRECYAKLQQRRQSNDSLSSSCIVQSRPLRSSSMPKKSSPKIQSDDVKVEKMEDKDEWKITIKISCSQSGNDKNAEQLNSSSTEKCVASVDSSTATVTQKQETQTQTSRCE